MPAYTFMKTSWGDLLRILPVLHIAQAEVEHHAGMMVVVQFEIGPDGHGGKGRRLL